MFKHVKGFLFCWLGYVGIFGSGGLCVICAREYEKGSNLRQAESQSKIAEILERK